MKNIFICMLMLFSVAYAQVYSLDLIIHKNDSVGLDSITIRNGSGSEFPASLNNNYEFRIIAKNGSLLFSQPFELNFIAHGDPLENSNVSEEFSRDKIENIWNLPYYDNGQYIQLFHENNKIWEYQIPQENKNPEPSIPSSTWLIGGILVVIIILGLGYLLMKNRGKNK